MSSPAEPFPEVIRWLSRHAGFPAGRLPAGAETMVCLAALAATGEAAENKRHLIQGQSPAQAASLRAHALRRSRVHYKSDNGQKV